jgi:hypothetical protein
LQGGTEGAIGRLRRTKMKGNLYPLQYHLLLKTSVSSFQIAQLDAINQQEVFERVEKPPAPSCQKPGICDNAGRTLPF